MTLRAICTAAAGLAFLGCAPQALAQAKPDASKQAKPEAAKPAKAAPARDLQAMFAAKYSARLCTDGGKCEITITVGANCTLSFDPYVLGIHAPLRDIDVRWVLSRESAGRVEFPRTNGVFFKSPSSGGQFSPPQYVNPTTYRSRDKNSGFSDNAYGVNVNQDGKACPTYDPSIINGAQPS